METHCAFRPKRYANVRRWQRHVVFTKKIEYTDFPLDEITLYFANHVIHLPSEY